MKILRTGHFLEGRLIGGWEFEPKSEEFAIMGLPEDGRVIVNGVEIVPWSEKRRESMKENSRGWVKV